MDTSPDARAATQAGCREVIGLLILIAVSVPCTDTAQDTPPQDASPQDNEVQRLPFADCEIHVETRGEGPDLLFLHGGGLDSRLWDRVFVEASRDYRAIRYDFPSFGRSQTPQKPFSQVDLLEHLLRTLDCEAVHLVGLSYGASVAIDFALAKPDRVLSLVAAAPGVSGYPWSKETMERFMKIGLAAQKEGAEAAVELWLKDPHMAAAMENASVRERIRRLHLENARSYSHPAPVAPLPTAFPRLEELEVPLLVMVGSRDVVDVLDIAEQLATRVAEARKITVEGAGHILNMEAPEAFASGLFSFLDEVSDQN